MLTAMRHDFVHEAQRVQFYGAAIAKPNTTPVTIPTRRNNAILTPSTREKMAGVETI